MRNVTKLMIIKWHMTDIDWMGYQTPLDNFSFHHLVVPRKDCQEFGLGSGYFVWNGAILSQYTGHEYLHKIERIDRDRFLYLTRLLVSENQLGRLDLTTLRMIDECLKGFEREYQGKVRGNKRVIKPEYTERRGIYIFR